MFAVIFQVVSVLTSVKWTSSKFSPQAPNFLDPPLKSFSLFSIVIIVHSRRLQPASVS